MIRTRLTTATIAAGWGLLVLFGWCLVMLLYLTIYSFAAASANPVTLPIKDFDTSRWNEGFFQAKGALRNDAAENADEELIPEAAYITCAKSEMTCIVATADVFQAYLNIDSTTYHVDTWNEHQITFNDDTAICATSAFAIGREAQTFTQTLRKKAVIPDYAAKSSLLPCSGKIDKDIVLVPGLQLYWHRQQEYDQRNGFYFHLLLVGLNVGYFGIVARHWYRRRRLKATGEADATA